MVRVLQSDESDGSYNGLRPHLCVETVSKSLARRAPAVRQNANPTAQPVKGEPGSLTLVEGGGGRYCIRLWSAWKLSSEGDSVEESWTSSSTVCCWRVIDKSVEKLSHNKPGPFRRVKACMTPLRDCAAFVVVQQVGGDVDRLSDLIPKPVLAYLKGE